MDVKYAAWLFEDVTFGAAVLVFRVRNRFPLKTRGGCFDQRSDLFFYEAKWALEEPV